MSVKTPPRQSTDGLQDRKWKESLAKAQTITATIPDASFVTVGPNAGLGNERTLAGSSAVTVTDNGPNSSVALNLSDTGVSAGTYVRATVAIDSKGRVTSASSNPGIPEYDADPSSPSNGDVWVLRTTSGGGLNAGTVMGLLAGITNAGAAASATFQLSYKTISNGIKRASLT